MMYTSKAAAERPDLDEQDASFAASLRRLPAKSEGTIRLFYRPSDGGGFYSVHEDDAFYVAKIVYNTNSVIKYLGSRSSSSSKDANGRAGVPSCTLSRVNALNFLRESLTVRQLKIEIWEKAKKSGEWILEKQASPGNLSQVEDLLFSNSDLFSAPVIVSIKLALEDGKRNVGIAYADASSKMIGTSEFLDNDLFSNVESLVVQLGIKEAIIPAEEKSTQYEFDRLRNLLDRCGVVVTERNRATFSLRNVEQDLNRLVSDDLTVTTRPEFELKQAMSAVAALISYLDLLSDSSNSGQFKLQHHDLGQFMRLDASALRALNVMPDPDAAPAPSGLRSSGSSGAGNARYMSLFGLLNRCRTAQGVRLLAQWLKQPLVNIHQIQERLNLVEIFQEDSEARDSLRGGQLKSMPDFVRISKRFQRGVAGLEEVVRSYQAIIQIPQVIDLLTSVQERLNLEDPDKANLIKDNWIDKLQHSYDELSGFKEMVEETIDLEQLNHHEFVIKPDFDEALMEIKKKMDKVRDALDEEHRAAEKDLGSVNLHWEKHSLYGYCLRLTRKESSVLRNKRQYHEYATLKNGVYFTTTKLKSLNSDHADLTTSYERKQNSLVREVISIASSYSPCLESLNTTIAHLDLVLSLSHVAAQSASPFVKPKLHEMGQGNLVLKEARHPCMEVQSDISFIPNDVEFVRGESEFHIITGPNMGGKSTYIRQVGVISLLAQIGSFVPCDEAELPVFDSILARVGAGDSQVKGVSTFMAEMLETAAILKSATNNSLIIIDELGRGTSTYDGFGLAWAISEYIVSKIKSFCLFATHFHELCNLSQESEQVKNFRVMASVEDNPNSLTGRDITLLYKVEKGISDESFGIHVAELANFPVSVIKLAKRKAEDLEDTSGQDGHNNLSNRVTREDLESGTALVGDMLQSWAKKTKYLDVESEDQPMDQDKDNNDDNMESKIAKEYDELRQCFEEYRAKLQENKWTNDMILS